MVNMRSCLFCGDHTGEMVALGIRARYANTNAIWAPNLSAYLCANCARSGCRITVDLEPTTDGRVTTTTTGPRGSITTALLIGKGTKVTPNQEALL